MIAVVPVRGGALPLGGDEAVAEAGGVALLAGDGVAAAAGALGGQAVSIRGWEVAAYAVGAWAKALAPALRDHPVVVLPASPDGRDLAPRLAQRLGRPLHAGALIVRPDCAVLVRDGGRSTVEVALGGPAVLTLQPGVRGVEPVERPAPAIEWLELAPGPSRDAEVVAVLPPDPATIDLAEAPRILAGGAGLRGPADFALLADVAGRLGASMGATRVVADAGWVPFARQIGTTGVTVDPDLYVAFGVSGAVQHTSGLGAPRHVVAVNLDRSCPMMAMADLALVTDAPALLEELARRV